MNVYVRESKTSRLITPTMFICSCICNTSLLKECIYNFKCTQTWQEYTGTVLGGGAFGGYSPPPSPPPLSEIFRICGRVIIQAPSSPPPNQKSRTAPGNTSKYTKHYIHRCNINSRTLTLGDLFYALTICSKQL